MEAKKEKQYNNQLDLWSRDFIFKFTFISELIISWTQLLLHFILYLQLTIHFNYSNNFFKNVCKN